ncbi:hypothetical protein [Mycolicibacterium hodleri]|uniref:Uncharacterized protein n=1 Tax=Mycolicibacterium hodleri TaxID=49897 RepID=A0A502DUZ7_9MYCO|nr:hypothetical protein [Mycolicibacterium hodleri]TPG28142.1 hypothetical protein EAH80_27825 [Mycolicibacterium hodleri]
MTTTTPTSTSGPKGPRRVDESQRGGAASVAPMRRSGGHGRRVLAAAAMVLAVIATVLLVLALTRQGAERPSGAIRIPATPIAGATGGDSPPPWPAPTDVAAAVARSGLPLLRAEGTALHIHAHLDVFVDGTPVVIPAGIGIDERGGTISPLHTHDSSGVIHVESPIQSTFTLAEFFSEWNVTLSASHIGGLSVTPGSPLRAYVNGHRVPGNPGALTLHNHDEIAVVYGSIPAHIPGS